MTKKEYVPIEDWIQKTPGMEKLIQELICHAENSTPEGLHRLMGFALRDYLDDYLEKKR